jgi:hypothetical protein
MLFTLFVWNPHAWGLRLVNQCVVANSNEARFPVEFADNMSFATISPSSDKLWEDLVPPNLGLVMKMGEKGERVPYGIAVFSSAPLSSGDTDCIAECSQSKSADREETRVRESY